jgi:mannosyltransferase
MVALEGLRPPLRRWWAGLLGLPSWVAPAIIGVVALALRLHGLGDKPLWLDEIATLRRATATLPGLVDDSLYNSHYPSYFLLLWLVGHLGTSQWLLRLPSALFGAIAASLTCAIGSRVAGARAGVIAGLLMAFSPFEVQLGQEARSYTLVCCLILTALLGLVRLAQEPASAVPLHRPGAMRGAWLAYGIGTAAALNVLNVAAAWLVAANLSALAIAWYAGDRRLAFLRNWLMVQLAVVATWVPALLCVYLVSQGGVVYATHWVPAVSGKTLWATIAPVYLLRISSFITFGMLPAGVPALAVVSASLALFGVWRLRREPLMLMVLGGAAVILPLGFVLLSLFVPVLVPRYFAWSAGPFFILAGAALGRLSLTSFVGVATGLAVACLVNLLPYYTYETKPRWDLVATQLAAAAQPGDVVLADSYYSYLVLSTFATREGLDDHGVTFAFTPAEAVEKAGNHSIWAVFGPAGQVKKKPSPDDFRRQLAALGEPVAENPVGRYIVLWQFRPPG